MLYDGQGLGYVTATHQLIRRRLSGTVFSYYRALLLETPRVAWAEAILAELEGAHPDIRRLTTRLDIFRNGHAMRRPTPGSLFHDHSSNGWPQGQREILAEFQSPRLTLAHADLSGFSLFEEAQYRGVVAAERLLRVTGQRRWR